MESAILCIESQIWELVSMQKISEWKSNQFIYNHVVYDPITERSFGKHSHALTELIYVIRGAISYTIENTQFVAHAGDLIVIKPYSYHYFSMQDAVDYEKISILFPMEKEALERWTDKAFLLLDCKSGRIHDIFAKIDFYYHNCPKEVFLDLARALTKEICINVTLFHEPQEPTEHTQVHPVLERALTYVNENLFSFNTVKELAERLSVSEGYLKALFTEHLKIPPKKYVTEKKMLMAKTMIAAGTPPTQVAYRCGYTNYVTFYRLYVKTFGVKPTEKT